MRLRYLCVWLLFPSAMLGQSPSGKPTSTPLLQTVRKTGISLPVKKVVLYKNGVGYFEHKGQVQGNQEFGIEFTTTQLNDVLKSLTLVDLQGGSINAVRYNSVAPLDEQLKGLQIPLSEEVTSAAFLIALRGTRVEVRSGASTASGKVFSVETVEKETPSGGTTHVTQLAIVTDAGEMRLFELTPGLMVRAAEADIQQDLSHYLTLMGSTRSKDVRRMTISATGSGERDIMVSYISEVPVWKSTYRIVIPKAPAQAFLQGWAIVDNTVGEDWTDVKLSLVSGTPQSFVQNISQPYYTRRPVVPLPESVMLAPQAHEATMTTTDLAAPAIATRGGAGGVPGGVAGGSMGRVIGGVGGGTGGGRFALPPPPGEVTEDEEAAEVTDALRREEAAAEGLAVGELFEYNLKEKITVLKNQSALVPIVQSPIKAEQVTLITTNDNSAEPGTPLRALWLHNTSGLTLDGGTFNVQEQDSFAGEGIMDLLHPGERRLLSYAADRAVRVVKQDPSGSRTYTRVTVLQGILSMHSEEREATTYLVYNADTTPRQVILEHPIRNGWKLLDDVKPEETSATRYRFRVAVQPGKMEKFTVNERRLEVTRIAVSNVTDSQVAAYVQQGSVKPGLEGELRKVIAKKSEVSGVDQGLKSVQQEADFINRDQARLRENMKALKGSPEEKALLQRYTKELDGQEDRLALLQKQAAVLKTQRELLQTELDTMVMAFSVDESL